MKYKVRFTKTIAANDGTQIGGFEIPGLECISTEAGLVKFNIENKPAFFVSPAVILSILPAETEVFNEAVEDTKEKWREYSAKERPLLRD